MKTIESQSEKQIRAIKKHNKLNLIHLFKKNGYESLLNQKEILERLAVEKTNNITDLRQKL